MSIPHAFYTSEALASLPPADVGDTFTCPRCHEEHELYSGALGGDAFMLFYQCGQRVYLGGVAGKLVACVRADGSGEVPVEVQGG